MLIALWCWFACSLVVMGILVLELIAANKDRDYCHKKSMDYLGRILVCRALFKAVETQPANWDECLAACKKARAAVYFTQKKDPPKGGQQTTPPENEERPPAPPAPPMRDPA